LIKEGWFTDRNVLIKKTKKFFISVALYNDGTVCPRNLFFLVVVHPFHLLSKELKFFAGIVDYVQQNKQHHRRELLNSFQS